MTTTDDDLLRQVLEAVGTNGFLPRGESWVCAYHEELIEQVKVHRGWEWRLTASGRAKLDELKGKNNADAE